MFRAEPGDNIPVSPVSPIYPPNIQNITPAAPVAVTVQFSLTLQFSDVVARTGIKAILPTLDAAGLISALRVIVSVVLTAK
jgi:hypothetical protein